MKTIILKIKKYIYKLINHNILDITFDKEDDIYNENIEYIIARINVIRIIPISIILLIIQLISFVVDFLWNPHNLPIKYIYFTDILFLMLSIIFIYLSNKFLNNENTSINTLRVIYRVFWIIFLFIYLCIMLLKLYNKDNFNNPISMMFIISLVPLFNNKERLLYFIFPIVIYLAGSNIGITVKKSVFFHMIMYVLFTFGISTILYNDMFKQIKIKLKLEKMNKELAIMTNVDPLTRLSNRRSLRKTAERLWKNKDNEISVAIIDIDFFKQYNDLYGHLKGDECLISIANIMISLFGNTADEVARIGGEEFLVLFNNIEYDLIIELLEKFRVMIFELGIKAGNTKVSNFVTVSIGVTKPKKINSMALEDFYKVADEAMYEAKRTGRNRIVIK